MALLLLLTLSWSMVLTSASLCDITETVRTSEDNGKYFSQETNNTCYVFSIMKATVRDAQNFCRSIGGSLTDVESGTDNKLQKVLAEEKKNNSDFDTSFWIGLMWNYHVGYWYWDNGATQILQHPTSKPGRPLIGYLKACVSMTVKELVEITCGVKNAFICKIDIPDQDCHTIKPTNSNSCTPRCVDYITTQKSITIKIPSTTATTPSWNDTTTGADAANTTDDGDQSSIGAHDKFLAECQTTAADYQLVLILMASLGALAAIFFVTSIVMCAKLIQYRRMLSDKDSPIRISMVDILHVDSPSTARRKRPGNHSGSNPGSTSELLNNNPYNTYTTPDSDVGQAAESPDFIYQENGYSSVTEPSRSGEVVTPDSQPDRAGNVYMLLNRDTEDPDHRGPQNVYGLGSASTAPTDSRKTSDPYEIYSNQQ